MKPQHRGFTLIELIVVLVIIGVLAVSLLPRFFSADGTKEYLYRDQILNITRHSQMQAIQCTGCIIPLLTVIPQAMGEDVSRCPDDATTLCIPSSDGIKFSFSNGLLFQFNSLGQPLDPAKNRICAAGCKISIQGTVTTGVCIEYEGFIHPC